MLSNFILERFFQFEKAYPALNDPTFDPYFN
jgi:hypothetical protein